jgi:hypothetical protein
MKWFKRIRKNIAKMFLKKSLKIISELSWEELDSIFPKANYKDCFDFKEVDWSKINFTHSYYSYGERKDA